MNDQHGLGRVVLPDSRDEQYPFALALRPRKPRSKVWRIGDVLDQGQTSQCTAYAWKGWLLASPKRQGEELDPAVLYDREQLIDRIPMPHEGSTVRAGAQVFQGDGYVQSYLWARDALAVRDWVVAHGPVVLGTNWYTEMFDPSAEGYAIPAGDLAGGHAYLCYGWNEPEQAFLCLNSWGSDWGMEGRFKVGLGHLDWLLSMEGEACTAVEQLVRS